MIHLCCPVNFSKSCKELCEIFLSDAGSWILNRYDDATQRIAIRSLYLDFTLVCELEGIFYQVDQYLLETSYISAKHRQSLLCTLNYTFLNIPVYFNTFGVCLRTENITDKLYDGVWIKNIRLERKLSLFYLSQVYEIISKGLHKHETRENELKVHPHRIQVKGAVFWQDLRF